MYTEQTIFKCLGINGECYYGGKGWWDRPTPSKKSGYRKGRWRQVSGELVECWHGLHLATYDSLLGWLAPEIYEAEIHPDAAVIRTGEKLTVSKARLIRPVETWTPKVAYLVACDIAAACVDRVRDKLGSHEGIIDQRIAEARVFAETAVVWGDGSRQMSNKIIRTSVAREFPELFTDSFVPEYKNVRVLALVLAHAVSWYNPESVTKEVALVANKTLLQAGLFWHVPNPDHLIGPEPWRQTTRDILFGYLNGER